MRNNKTVVIFLIKFFGTYALLFLLYSFYLNKTQRTTGMFECAPITTTVAEQSNYLLNLLGYDSEIEQHEEELSVKLILNSYFIARVVEGCNSISIIILFIAFIIAFASSFKTTFLYILFGSLIIYFFNILRIAVIAIALYEYPQYQNVLHEIVFPVLIYGITFLLWFIWIKRFAKINK
ncbi:exosortase family protein XrtF [Lutibacter sp. B1]|uniref:exosortase family protein XrtF n=1 Tax=Lutibacter sp. B1 TaxID=2725996 RepID=UPI0014572289|nr:exosortase family protein XrtF [Lutibacter sp. B1]